MRDQHRIFVQIPSYRDPQLVATLFDLAEQASSPSRIRVVVCWQHGPEEGIDAFQSAGIALVATVVNEDRLVHSLVIRGVAIELIDIPFLEAEGAGWARSVAQQRYRGEMYNLQIDAHHRFAKDWDSEMIGMLEELKAVSPKPLLTGHPPAFWPETYPEGRQERAAVMFADKFTADGIIRFKAEMIPEDQSRVRPVRARFMSGGFVFSEGAFVNEVPQDPHHFFATEEIVMTVRAYTHGFDMFHPHRPLLWHYYGTPSPKVWDDHMDDSKVRGRVERSVDERMAASAQRAMSLLGLSGESDEGAGYDFQLGVERTLRDYERYAGLSFTHRGIHKSALVKTEPDDSLGSAPDADWQNELICKRTLRVVVSYEPSERLELDSVQVSMETECGDAIVIKDLSRQDIATLTATSTVELLHEHSSGPQHLPVAFVVEAITSHPDAQQFFSVAAQEIQD